MPFLNRFCSKCSGLKRFGAVSKQKLSTFLKENKSVILEEYFVSAYCDSDESLIL